MIDLKKTTITSQGILFEAPVLTEYMAVIVPPEEIQKEITGYKNKVWKSIGSFRSRYSRPQISLVNFLLADERKEINILSGFQQVISRIKSLDIMINGFDSYVGKENRNTCYMALENKKMIADLSIKLAFALDNCGVWLKSDLQRPVLNPHITIARQLKQDQLQKVIQLLDKPYEKSLKAEKIILLKSINGLFTPIADFYFGTALAKERSYSTMKLAV